MMKKTKQRLHPLAILLAALTCQPLLASGDDEPDSVQIKEQWGQLLFCERIYTMPEVRTRIYSFDTEACNKAGKVISDAVARYTPPEQARLKHEAEQHAVKLSYNTSEPYHSVPACREYCNELANSREDKND